MDSISSDRCKRSLLAFVLATLAFTPVQAQNLVSNPGFESGADDWHSLFSPFNVTAGAFSGAACAQVNLPVGNAPGIAQDMADKLQPGQSYTWTAWLRVSPSVPPPPR